MRHKEGQRNSKEIRSKVVSFLEQIKINIRSSGGKVK